MNRHALLLLFVAPLLVGAADRPLVLGGPEVIKLDWNTRALRQADVNGDGRQDLVLLNNDRATIELLLQRPDGQAPARQRSLQRNRWEPVLEDARFIKESFSAGVTLYDLALGDLDADGRIDLVYTGSPHALTVQLQTAEGGWKEVRVTPAPTPSQVLDSLLVQDLDGDGRADLVMLGQTELAVYRQSADGSLEPPTRFPLPDENAYGLQTADFDGDGRVDLMYAQGRDPKGTLRVRRQTTAGEFGPELVFAVDRLSSRVELLPSRGGETPANRAAPALAYVAAPVGQLQVVRFAAAATDEAALPRARMFRPRLSGRAPAAYATGDFDGDGQLDVAASDTSGAQLSVYFRQAGGQFTEAQVYPSLSEAEGIAAVDWDGDGKDELFIASAKERLVGRTAVGEERRLNYPSPLPVSGKPTAIAAAREASGPRVAVAVEEQGSHRIILLSARDNAVEFDTSVIPLPKLRTDPSGLLFWDANQDGRLDLAVFVPRDFLKLFVQEADGSWRDVSQNAEYRRGLVDNVERPSVTLLDVAADGHRELVVSGRGFARALKLGADGGLQIVEQFNARSPTAEISATLVRQRQSGAAAEVILYDRRGEELSLLQPDENDVYQVTRTQAADRIDVVASVSNETELFLFGADRFWWLPLAQAEFASSMASHHVTDLPEVRYAYLRAGDFDADGNAEVVAVDTARNVIEVLAADPEEPSWRSRLHFVVFEMDPHRGAHAGPGFEPREALIGDVTGDQKADLILLVHDRVLVYPQR